MYDIVELSSKPVTELKEIAKNLKIKNFRSMKKQELIYSIMEEAPSESPAVEEKTVSDPEPEKEMEPVVESGANGSAR